MGQALGGFIQRRSQKVRSVAEDVVKIAEDVADVARDVAEAASSIERMPMDAIGANKASESFVEDADALETDVSAVVQERIFPGR